MSRAKKTPPGQPARDLSKDLREQALQIINTSLEEAHTQHPLDAPGVFEYARPTLGGTVPIELYRAVRLLGFREVVGSKISAAILNVSGRSVAQKMGIRSVQELICALDDFSVGQLTTLTHTEDRVVLAATECATCSGLPNIGEPVCHFEAGFIAGGLEKVLGKPVKVQETQCWGLGYKVCRWEAERDTKPPNGGNGQVDPLEVLMTLAGKAISSVDNAVALRQKNRQLREAYHRLQESERLKQDLTDMVVHDMRVPLTAAMGSVEALKDMLHPRLSKQEAELLRIAMSSSQTLINMIDDLLDVSKLEEGQFSLLKEPVSLVELIEDAIEQVGVLTRRKGLALDACIDSDLPPVQLDKYRMGRVLINLIGNAIQHTSSPNGRISVTTNYNRMENFIRVSVSDNGEGIPERYLSKIFDKFAQVESREKRKCLSTGIGLAFCKLVTEAHGGKISVQSEPGKGSVFSITIPVE